MEEVSIKVSIASREYPLKIKKADEALVMEAAQKLNDRIKEYESQYAVSDKIDLLAMCAMQFATELVTLSSTLPQERQEVKDAVADIDSLISEYFKK